MTPFGERLGATFESLGQLCVGIDPHSYLLKQWGLDDSASGARDLGLRVVDAAAGRAGIVKPQVAFFERFGSAGYAALEEVLLAARSAGLLVIADVKRGDVGTSVEAYAEAWLTPGSPLEADAMTIAAYQGVGSIEAPIALAERHGKGLFVLAATSNEEAGPIQTALLRQGDAAGTTVAASIVGDVIEWNRTLFPRAAQGTMGSIGVVLGATVDLEAYGINLGQLAATPGTPVLAPGFGHQGASYAEIGTIFGAAASVAVISASRSILSAGPDGIAGAIETQVAEVAGWRG